MDVGAPSNFERMQALYDDDLDALRRDVVGCALRRRAGRGRDRRASTGSTAICSIRTAPSPGWRCRTRWPSEPRRARRVSGHGASRRSSARSWSRRSGEPVPLPRPLAEALAGRGTSVRCPPITLRCERIPECDVKCRHVCQRPMPTLDDLSAPSPASLPARDAIPARYTWDLTAICRDWDDWTAELSRARRGDRGVQVVRRARWPAVPERCWPRSARWTRWARSATASGITRRCTTTRISATTRSTRGGSRCRSCSPAQQQASSWFNPELLAIPLDTIRGWLDANDGAGASTASPSRACSTSRSTCSTSRASGCCRLRAASTACRTTATAALTTADMKFPTITLAAASG